MMCARKGRGPPLLGRWGGASWLAPLLIVVVEAGLVEGMLAAGVGPGLGGERCPRCEGRLTGWGSYRRVVRWGAGVTVFGVARCRCVVCGVSHALLPAFLVARRMDLASAIGMALGMAAAGRGHRPVAAVLDVPATTVRGWLRRLRSRAGGLRALFVRLALQLGAQPGRAPPPRDVLVWLLDAITAAHRAARERLGTLVAGCVWSFSSAASGGMWLANTDAP